MSIYDSYLANAFIIGNDDGYLADKDENIFTLFPIYAQVFFDREEAETTCTDFTEFGFKTIPVTVEVCEVGGTVDHVQVIEVK